MRVAIASICIGDEFKSLWTKHGAKRWEAYAKRHGYSLVMFEQPLDTSPRGRARSPAWQKCLVLNQPELRDFDRVVWVDSDIVISASAPPIAESVPQGKIGAVVSGDYLHPDMKPIYLSRLRGKPLAEVNSADAWTEDQRLYYAQAPLPYALPEIIQTGVLVLGPEHRQVLQAVYDDPTISELRWFEQLPLSRAIVDSGLLHRIDSRFNLVFFERAVVHYPYLILNPDLPNYDFIAHLAVMTELANSYFLHFAFRKEFMRYLAPA
jgi:hypothetical protein